jgi:hypothetical protein
MAAYGSIEELKNAINDSIYANDAGLVTAEILQERLHDVIDTLSALGGSGGADLSSLEEENALTQIFAGADKVATEAWVGEQEFIPATEKGSSGGIAELDETGKVPADQLPDTIGEGSVESLATTNFWVGEESGKLVFKYGATVIASLSSAGYLKVKDEWEGFVAAP